MKKIINGKKYDTETAKEVACKAWYYYGDLNFVIEKLYKKKTGEFFLYAAGGATVLHTYLLACSQSACCRKENIFGSTRRFTDPEAPSSGRKRKSHIPGSRGGTQSLRRATFAVLPTSHIQWFMPAKVRADIRCGIRRAVPM